MAATSAFAQSAVTLSGNMDFAYANVSGDKAAYKGNTITQMGYAATTSKIGIKANEDLGGGLKAEAFYELDPRNLATDGGALQRHQSYVGLSGGFGTVKLGAPDSLGLAAWGAVSPLGTGIGSGYAPGGNNTGVTGVISTRWSRSAQYNSPSFNGFTASLNYATGGDETTAPAKSDSANGIPVNRTAAEFGLTYASGPLAIAFVNISNGELKNGATNGATGGAAANSAKSNANVLGAQYNFGATTVYGAYISGDVKAATGNVNTDPAQVNAYRMAVKHTMGQIDLIASYQNIKLKDTNPEQKDKITGLRADYNFSKRTAAYLGYESWNSFADNDTRKATAIGIRHSF